MHFLGFAELYSRYPISPKRQASHCARVSSLCVSVPGPAAPLLRGGPAAAAPGAGGAASPACGQVGPGEGELGVVTCPGPFLTEEAHLKPVGALYSVLELFENAEPYI